MCETMTTRPEAITTTVVCVTELIDSVIAIHGLWTFLADVYGTMASLINLVRRSGSLSLSLALPIQQGSTNPL